MGNRIVINVDLGKHVIDKDVYGHFVEHFGRCIYDGMWVGENSPIPNTRGMRNDIARDGYGRTPLLVAAYIAGTRPCARSRRLGICQGSFRHERG